MKRFGSVIGRYNLTYKLFSSDYPLQQKTIAELHEFTNNVSRIFKAPIKLLGILFLCSGNKKKKRAAKARA
jgi:hypothetical protein